MNSHDLLQHELGLFALWSVGATAAKVVGANHLLRVLVLTLGTCAKRHHARAYERRTKTMLIFRLGTRTYVTQKE